MKIIEGKELCTIVRYKNQYSSQWIEMGVCLNDNGKPYGYPSYGIKDNQHYSGLLFVHYIDPVIHQIPRSPEYREIYSVDKQMAAKMVKTITRIEREMEKMNEKAGYISGLGSLLIRFSTIVGAKKTFIQELQKPSLNPSSQWKLLDVMTAADVVVEMYSQLKTAKKLQTV
jgi:hypothetical protein